MSNGELLRFLPNHNNVANTYVDGFILLDLTKYETYHYKVDIILRNQREPSFLMV